MRRIVGETVSYDSAGRWIFTLENAPLLLGSRRDVGQVFFVYRTQQVFQREADDFRARLAKPVTIGIVGEDANLIGVPIGDHGIEMVDEVQYDFMDVLAAMTSTKMF